CSPVNHRYWLLWQFRQTSDHEYYSFLNADSSVDGIFQALYWLERFLTAPQSHHLPYDHRSMVPTPQSPLLQEMQSPRLQIKPQYKKHLVDVSFFILLLETINRLFRFDQTMAI